MRHDRTGIGWAFLAASLLLAATAQAQQKPAATQRTASWKPTLRGGTLPPDYKLSGQLSAAWWAATDSIANLVTIEPEEGAVPAGQTVVKILANQNSIVVGVRCYDDEPDGIVSFSKARDSELEGEDHVVIVFDTFLDGRSGYAFAVNPSGARYDGLVLEEGVNSDWDAIWETKTWRDGTGWSAEFRIPVLSLRFKKDLTTWGFNVQRRVQRLQETSRWSGVNLDYEIFQTKRAGLLTDLPLFELGAGSSIRPALVSRARTPNCGVDTEYDLEPSLDVTQKLGPNLLSALTVNTDFAETEVDVRQINLTRFPLFFPEKRSFFLEGVDIFEFGLGLDEENLLPFFSRRIGLYGLDEEDQLEIPINVGGKIEGRIANTNLGALIANTREVEALEVEPGFTVPVPPATMGAMRVSQNVLEESSLGILATFGDQLDRGDAWSAGADFTYETSSFRRDKNLQLGVWGMLNDRSGLKGDKSAYGFRIEYPNDLLDTNFTSIHIGDGFDPSLGFVPRNNVHIWDFGLEYNPRPLWPGIHQMFHELSFTVFNKRNNSTWESYGVTVKPLDWLLESGDRFEAGIEPEGDRPSAVFEISDDVDIPPGSYEWVRYFLGARAADKRNISGELRWDFGSYYDGDLSTLEGRLTVKPSAFLWLEFTGERSLGDVRALIDDFEEAGSFELIDRKFTEELYGIGLQVNFTPNLQVSSLTQYDTQSKEFGSNSRLHWSFSPLGEVFVVYNHNLRRNLNKRWEFVSNELPVKIQYTWRF